MTDFKMVPLAEIKPDPNQPRKYYDETAMQELTDSIKEKGVLQPLLIRPIGSSEAYRKEDLAATMDIETRRTVGYTGPVYILVCGERRYRASTTAGLSEIPAVIRELSDEEALELQIIENLQRKDVHPMEEAVAFKSLVEKGKDLMEIAARVGKSVYYVRQRIKLCDLSEEWQQAYYANRISSKIAVTLCTFDDKMQKEMWKERGVSSGSGAINIDDWFINRFRGDLKKATFGLDDDMLDKKAGACINCQFNSSVASLFPEAAESPVCSNKKCYLRKTDLHFEKELQKAKEDPAVIFVNDEYYPTEDKLVKALTKGGFTVLNGRGYGQGNFDVMASAPEPPSLQDFDIEDYDNEAERDEAYQEELKDYEKQLKEYNNKVAGGKYKKAFCFCGSNKGKYIFIEIRKGSGKAGSSKATKDKEAAGKLTAADVTDEIKRIQDREKRAKELDAEKVHTRIVEAVKADKTVKTVPDKISSIDKVLIRFLLHEYINYNNRDLIKKHTGLAGIWGHNDGAKLHKELEALSDEKISFLVRQIMIDKHSLISPNSKTGYMFRKMAESLGTIPIEAFEQEQKEIAEKRQARVNARITELKEKQKELTGTKKEKPANKSAKKATTK